MSHDLKNEIRLQAEADLVAFINLVAPGRVLGSIHEDVCNWWTKENAKSHQLLLLPRDHMKSALIAFRVAWELTKDPTLRVLYISSFSNLAQKQLSFIKQIFESEIHRRYWPEHIHPEEGKRSKWTASEIELDHPLRAKEQVRDPSIFTGGLTTSLTGLHCDIAVLDDVVVQENAYTQEGRNKVKTQYSLLASIEGADAKEWVVGTRYHPKDLYSELIKMEQEVYEGEEVVDMEAIYESMEHQVEDSGTGVGEFLWPRQHRYDGKVFGFDKQVLAKKRAQYLDRFQFRAQYYNDPNDPDSRPVDPENFQYYDKKHLGVNGGRWWLKDRPLNVIASIDFAYTKGKRSDYSAIVVIGIDSDSNIYVLDIDRFKEDRIAGYFEKILHMTNKWNLRKLRCEVTAAQATIVKDLKDNYIKAQGINLKILEHRPTSHSGSKEERIDAALSARYDNQMMWHYRGGNCQVLEEELLSYHPPHDDVKDALASAVEVAIKPSASKARQGSSVVPIATHPRFGGVAH